MVEELGEDDVGVERLPPRALWMPSRIELARLLLDEDFGRLKDEKVGECGGDWAETSEVMVSMQVAVDNSRRGGWIEACG